jgi:biotin carboxyl carrier protein
MKRYQITLSGRTFDVRLLSDPLQEQVQVEVDGEVFTVEVQALASGEETVATVPVPGLASHPAPVSLPSTVAGEQHPIVSPSHNTMTAPLPGVIKSIAVRPGQQVGIGDELLIIEAMKMDNIIRAACQGVVGTIHITEGHRVAHGEPMLEIRP